MEKSFKTTIDGYWREVNVSGLPSHSGVYFVYRCTLTPSNTVSIHQLLYIGEGENVNRRVTSHNKFADWRKHLRPGEELCFSTCPVESYYRERVEAAYIFKHKPPCNTDCTSCFNYDRTTIASIGGTTLLSTNFTVERT